MTAPTHLSLGGLAYLAGCAFIDRQPQVSELAMVGAGSLFGQVDLRTPPWEFSAPGIASRGGASVGEGAP